MPGQRQSRTRLYAISRALARKSATQRSKASCCRSASAAASAGRPAAGAGGGDGGGWGGGNGNQIRELSQVNTGTGDNTATLTIFMLEQWLLVATTGNSVGHLITGIRVRRLDGNYVGILPALVRIGLILLVIPAVIWDSDNRGLHDKAARTVLVRR